MTPKQLEPTIRGLLKQPLADAELRTQLEQLAAAEMSFPGFTWLYGPVLYRRNRILFRPFLLSRFSTYLLLPKRRAKAVPWKGAQAEALEGWLAEADRNDDAELFRRLYEWKMSARSDWRKWDARSQAILAELRPRFESAGSPSRRQTVLRKFDFWFRLDEESACALYAVDPATAGPYLLRRLPVGWFSGESKRVLWRRLFRLAQERKDEAFAWQLYRRQAPLDEWLKDCLELCDQIKDPTELAAALEQRHPEGHALNLAEGFYQLVQRRGREVFPYVMRHLRQVWGGWLSRGSYGKMADHARAQGWWDLWSALIRVCSRGKEFNQQVLNLLEDRAQPDPAIVERLRALAGVSREWNWPGLGLATTHQLTQEVALKFFARFPELLRGPYRLHLQTHLWGETYSKLLDAFIAAEDTELIDLLASRMVTRCGRWGNTSKLLHEAEKLADYYGALKTDEAQFSRRAARVLGQVPAYSIYLYHQLVRENRLARLLFERSVDSYLAEPSSVADLVEASEIHVMALAYRALGLDDDRAREQAAQHLPLLLGTLLRPMQRDTRALVFRALANAANTLERARLILDRAREALNLPDTRYPKETLLGLIGQLLRRWPELRGPREQPVVYGRAA